MLFLPCFVGKEEILTTVRVLSVGSLTAILFLLQGMVSFDCTTSYISKRSPSLLGEKAEGVIRCSKSMDIQRNVCTRVASNTYILRFLRRSVRVSQLLLTSIVVSRTNVLVKHCRKPARKPFINFSVLRLISLVILITCLFGDILTP